MSITILPYLPRRHIVDGLWLPMLKAWPPPKLAPGQKVGARFVDVGVVAGGAGPSAQSLAWQGGGYKDPPLDPGTSYDFGKGKGVVNAVFTIINTGNVLSTFKVSLVVLQWTAGTGSTLQTGSGGADEIAAVDSQSLTLDLVSGKTSSQQVLGPLSVLPVPSGKFAQYKVGDRLDAWLQIDAVAPLQQDGIAKSSRYVWKVIVPPVVAAGAGTVGITISSSPEIIPWP